MSIFFAYKVKSGRLNLDDAKFRYHPVLEDDEILSSWIVRTAFSHLTDPATFVNLYLPKYRNSFWDRDIDVSASKELLEMLAYKSGFSYDLLYRLTLKSYEGYLAECITDKTRNAFIQPLGRYCRVKVLNGLRFCPLCVQEDNAPYFRKKWRLSFSTACVKHKCFLKDRCEECGSAVNPYRSMREHDLGISYCYKCGADLRQGKVELIPEGSYGLWAIKKLYEILETGLYNFHGGYTYSFLFFNVLRLFAKITYFWGMRLGFLEHEVMSHVIDFRRQEMTYNLIENIPLKGQYLLFSGLVRLFEGFPGRVFSFCGANRLRGSDLKREMEEVPFWYQQIVNGFNMEAYRVSIEEVENVIRYLKAKGTSINKANVARTLGICADFKKRKDIQKLLLWNSL